MKHKAFTNIIAHSTRVPEKTVAMFARNLKSAGLLTTGARGVNAPEMTMLDFTRMLITVCATDRPGDAADMCNRYHGAVSDKAAMITIGDTEIEILEGTELEDLVSSMLALPHRALQSLGLYLFIHWNRYTAEVAICEAKITFKIKLTDEQIASYGANSGGITTTRGLASHELEEMAFPFVLEKEDGTNWEDMVSSGNAAMVASRHIFGDMADGNDDG